MSLVVNGRVVETDEEGFLEDPRDRDHEVAREIAARQKLELNDERWAIVKFARNYFEENYKVPEARTALKATQNMLNKEQATRKYLYQLFPYDYGQQACKIAGMRKPMLDV